MKTFILGIVMALGTAQALPQFANFAARGSRQLDFGDEAVAAPASGSYGAPVAESSPIATSYVPSEAAGTVIVEQRAQPSYTRNEPEAAASDLDEVRADNSLDLEIPGVAGRDYPIYSQAPETSFSCEGRNMGGYYADLDADCQSFHICGPGLDGRMAKYTFLCPNGTIFNQEYFTCDWWFNFDCQQAGVVAEARNAELFGAREAATRRLQEERLASASKVNEVIAEAPIQVVEAAEAPSSSYLAAFQDEAAVAPRVDLLPDYAKNNA